MDHPGSQQPAIEQLEVDQHQDVPDIATQLIQVLAPLDSGGLPEQIFDHRLEVRPLAEDHPLETTRILRIRFGDGLVVEEQVGSPLAHRHHALRVHGFCIG